MIEKIRNLFFKKLNKKQVSENDIKVQGVKSGNYLLVNDGITNTIYRRKNYNDFSEIVIQTKDTFEAGVSMLIGYDKMTDNVF